MEENKCIAHDRFRVTPTGRRELLAQGYGVYVPEPVVKLSDDHPCKGCIWYSRNTNVLFCPFPNCVRKKKGIGNAKEDENDYECGKSKGEAGGGLADEGQGTQKR